MDRRHHEMIDTTKEESAKEAGIFNEKFTYAPMPLLVGGGRIFEGLDEALVGAEVGKETEVIIPPEKAAGPRDPKLVEVHSVREFLKQDVEPPPGHGSHHAQQGRHHHIGFRWPRQG